MYKPDLSSLGASLFLEIHNRGSYSILTILRELPCKQLENYKKTKVNSCQWILNQHEVRNMKTFPLVNNHHQTPGYNKTSTTSLLPHPRNNESDHILYLQPERHASFWSQECPSWGTSPFSNYLPHCVPDIHPPTEPPSMWEPRNQMPPIYSSVLHHSQGPHLPTMVCRPSRSHGHWNRAALWASHPIWYTDWIFFRRRRRVQSVGLGKWRWMGRHSGW